MAVEFTVKKEWLQQVIAQHAGAGNNQQIGNRHVKVCSFTADRALAKGENYSALALRVSVVYLVNDEENERKLDLFIKVKPTGEEHRALAESVGAFVREAEVYNELIPDMRALVDSVGAPKLCYPDMPKCIFASGSGDQAAIVMEDLGIYGYKLSNRFEGATQSEVELVLKAFAKFHALGIEAARRMGPSYWATETRTKYPNLFSDPFTCKFLMDTFGDNAIFNNMEQALRKHNADDAEFLADRLKLFLEVSCGGRIMDRYGMLGKKVTNSKFMGFRLGDCWLNIMLFRYEVQDDGSSRPVAIKLLDFQLTQSGTMHLDLHYFFGSSARNEIFSQRKNLIQTIFYPELFRILSLLDSPLSPADYLFEDFWRDFQQEYGEYCIISAMIVLPVAMAEKEYVIPDVDKGVDISIDDFKTMNKDVLGSTSGSKVMDRFAHIVRTLVAENVM